MTKMNKLSLLGIAALAAFGTGTTRVNGATAEPLVLDSNLTLVVASGESGAVRRAAEDLRGDFLKVFGSEPRAANRLEDAGSVAILISSRDSLPHGLKCVTTNDREAFSFSIAGGPKAGQRVVCLVGADKRGTIYAAYEFSQSVLGVDPMYLWTDKMPPKRTEIPLPADFGRTYPSPVFRYRGFFINDEDLLTGWRPAPEGQRTGISLEVWDNIFETILRLKANMIAPGTWIFPDDAQVEAASRRGLIVNQHHATPIGLNAARWPAGVPYNYSTHPEILRRAWKNAVAEYKPDEEILWAVGLRGLSDQPYSALDTSVLNNDRLMGQRISGAIADQMSIVRQRFPKADFVTNLWMEGDRLKQEGYLDIPKEVTQVWADTGWGDMQDGGRVSAGEGMYFHVAMYNGHCSQLSELTPVATIQEEVGRYIGARATRFVLVNTSDIRPVAMTARAIMEVAWGGGGTEGPDQDGAYYRKWAAEEFGPESAQAVEKIYKEYFDAPALKEADSSDAGQFLRRWGDNHYATEVRTLILDRLSEHQVAVMPQQSPKWTAPRVEAQGTSAEIQQRIEKDIADAAGARARWDAVWADALAARQLVEPSRRDYYQAAVLTMIAINRNGNRMMEDIGRALQDEAASRRDQAGKETADALEALAETRAAMSAAEYGKWEHWYRGDWLTGEYSAQQLVQAYDDHLKDPMAKLPAPMDWAGWEAYFHIMRYEGDRSVDVE
jgi:Glycosyl hydrolase family 115